MFGYFHHNYLLISSQSIDARIAPPPPPTLEATTIVSSNGVPVNPFLSSCVLKSASLRIST